MLVGMRQSVFEAMPRSGHKYEAGTRWPCKADSMAASTYAVLEDHSVVFEIPVGVDSLLVWKFGPLFWGA